MLACFPATYRDQFGEESTTIQNDGETMRMQVRGVAFIGSDFDAFEPIPTTHSLHLSTFTLDHGSLCACEILCAMPLPVVVEDAIIVGTLRVHLTLGQPRLPPRSGIDEERLLLQFSFNDQTFTSQGLSGWFEDELLDIQRALPTNAHLKACIACAFSDYSPGGHGLFGGLACFRDHKAEYRMVNSKGALFQLWPKMTEYVQETYLCNEFEQRIPGSGYRG